jgi:hypothetical protein
MKEPSCEGGDLLPMLFKEGEPGWGKADDVAAVGCVEGDEAAVVCVFPHREFGTGRAPSIHRFFVAPLAFCEPFKKIEDQVLYYGIAHRVSLRSIIYRGCRERDENAVAGVKLSNIGLTFRAEN